MIYRIRIKKKKFYKLFNKNKIKGMKMNKSLKIFPKQIFRITFKIINKSIKISIYFNKII